MQSEDAAMQEREVELDARKKLRRQEEENKDLRDEKLEDQQCKEEVDAADLKRQLIDQLEEAAEIRGSRKKKKKKGGKKKKK